MKNFLIRDRKITTNKNHCIQIYWNRPYLSSIFEIDFKLLRFEDYFFNFVFSVLGDIFDLYIRWNRKVDHAGFFFNLSILGFSIEYNIYDCRHWDFENDKWEEYKLEENDED